MITIVAFFDFNSFLARFPHKRLHVDVWIFFGNLYKLSNYIRSKFDEFLKEIKKKILEHRPNVSRLNEGLL